ncbi:MAG TPA: hypothetical protein VID48_13070 [Solirubrobacteraceae bacterium]
MNDFHSDYRKQLVGAAQELFGAPGERAKQRIGRPRPLPLAAVIALAVLLLAAAAFAATQIIGFGAPVKASHRPGRERPSVSAGVGIPVAGAKSAPASAQLLGISVADPGGGLHWGMRIVRTTRDLVCVQIGRLLDGRLGVLGQDGEFKDDGLFHELPAAVLDPDTCIQPTVRALYSHSGLPAAGALPVTSRSCLAPGVHSWPSGPEPCPADDERLVAFGVLGPHAVSVSYRTRGQLRTVATAGRLGAYLIVLRAPPEPAHNIPVLGGTSGRLGVFPIATSSTAPSRIVFRFGDRLCQTGSERKHGGLPECTNSIARTPLRLPKIPRGLHSPIALKTRPAPGGYDLQLTFTAPTAVKDASTAYGVQVTLPNSRACGRPGVSGQSVERDVARGEVLHITEFVGQPPGCHGVVHGRVIFGAEPLPGAFFARVRSAETIGRFSFDLP